MKIQGKTLPSSILEDTHMHTSMCLPLYVYIIHKQIQTHTNAAQTHYTKIL